MGAIGPYHYKVWVIGDILDRYENCRNGARKPKAKLFVKPGEEEKLHRNAYFENIVRREARKLIVRAVNKFFHEVEKYRKTAKNTA